MIFQCLFSHCAEGKKCANDMRWKVYPDTRLKKKSIKSTTHLLSLFPFNYGYRTLFLETSIFKRRHCRGEERIISQSNSISLCFFSSFYRARPLLRTLQQRIIPMDGV